MNELMTWKFQEFYLVQKMWQVSDCQSDWIPRDDFIPGSNT